MASKSKLQFNNYNLEADDQDDSHRPTELALNQLNWELSSAAAAVSASGDCPSPVGQLNRVQSDTVDATINNDLAPSTAMDIQKDYNKAVFYLSYIISVELKKYMEKVEEILYSSRIEVLSPERLLAQ